MATLFEIKFNTELGRYLIAATDIKAGQIIIEEDSFVIGPKQNTVVVCLGCYCPLGGKSKNSRCKTCRWPLCSKCVDAADHKDECEVFSKAKVAFQPIDDPTLSCPQLDCITPLRMLLKIEKEQERWNKEVSLMEYHDVARREAIENWNVDLVNVVNYLRGPCKLERFSEDQIMKVIGILTVNAFEAKTSLGHALRSLYIQTALPAHNCVPNVKRSIYPSEGFRTRMRALIDIPKGEQINISYTYILSGTSARQASIRSGKFFTCRCKRCSDPSELGTHFSSLKCGKCDPGFVLTTDPFDNSADWKCSHCDFKTTGNAVLRAIGMLQSEVDTVEVMEYGPERLQKSELLLREYRNMLHKNHFILTNLRHNLIEMYGRVEGYEIYELPDVLLEHKEDLCRAVLTVLNVIEPGMSRSRAIILYELHVPIVLTTRTAYANGVLSGEPLKNKIQSAIDILEECVAILQHEDPNSQEGALCVAAICAVDQLKANLIKINSKIDSE